MRPEPEGPAARSAPPDLEAEAQARPTPESLSTGDAVTVPGAASPPARRHEGRDPLGLLGTTLESRYRFERTVAEGGFAVVYRGTDLRLDRPVAIKILKGAATIDGSTQPYVFARFRQEARIIARLTHPTIVHVMDYGVSALPSGHEAAWMVLEWITGHTLDEELRRRGRLRPGECLALLRPVIEALAYAHARGVAHRDIKPGNIMVTPTPCGPVARLLDFGIAKVMPPEERSGAGDTHSRAQVQAFSPRYLVPEQMTGTRTGPWTDVYGLALVLTELLTNRSPYEGANVTARFVDAMAPLRPTPAKRGVDVGAWEPVLRRAVAIHAPDRYADAGELLAALVEALPDADRPSGLLADDVAAALRPTVPPLAPPALPRPSPAARVRVPETRPSPRPSPPRPPLLSHRAVRWALGGAAALAVVLAAAAVALRHRAAPAVVAMTPIPAAPLAAPAAGPREPGAGAVTAAGPANEPADPAPMIEVPDPEPGVGSPAVGGGPEPRATGSIPP